jgi:hypothetical protein
MSKGCASEADLRKNLSAALAMENVIAEVNFYRIDDFEASNLGLRGSPSILVDGQDIQPAGVIGFS